MFRELLTRLAGHRLGGQVEGPTADSERLAGERDHANAAATELLSKLRHATDAREALEVRVQDLELALRLARRHMDTCPTALAVADHDQDKARENAQ